MKQDRISGTLRISAMGITADSSKMSAAEFYEAVTGRKLRRQTEEETRAYIAKAHADFEAETARVRAKTQELIEAMRK